MTITWSYDRDMGLLRNRATPASREPAVGHDGGLSLCKVHTIRFSRRSQ
jgi:hypothetical protein